MTVRVFVPLDTSACARGAEELALALQTRCGDDIELVRNGSRGLFWLEPMVEVETTQGRIAYGPVKVEDLDGLLEAGLLQGGEHPLQLGRTEEIPYLKQQQRLTFARVGVIDPVSVEDYKANGGFVGLQSALGKTAQQLVDEVKESGLRGRGGAAFPTGIKWQTVLDADPGDKAQKYIVCNADEGDSGTYADRMLMEGDPLSLVEGMAIAGLAVGATQGYIYLREEYPQAHKILNAAIAAAEKANYLGDNIQDSGKAFYLEVRLGAKAYICGEETSLLESLEGKRGMVRAKPPLPAIVGLFGQPTVVNNVISLATVPTIIAKGPEFYRDYGMGRSRGTLPFQLAGNIKQAGLVELAFGTTLRELLFDFGDGTRTGKPMRAVQVGGPLGAYLPESQWDTPLDYEAFIELDAVLGHGGVVAFDDSVDMSEQARFSMEFCVEESCGKCTPCRIGSTRGVEVIDRIRQGENAEDNKALLRDLCDTMVHGSLCAMGGMTPFPVLSALNHFSEDFESNPGEAS
jgi:formate dehydrogenase iron-sulfur subunit